MSNRTEVVGKWLDDLGVTLVNFNDPVDGSVVAGVDLEQLTKLMLNVELKIETEKLIARNDTAYEVALAGINRREESLKKLRWWQR